MIRCKQLQQRIRIKLLGRLAFNNRRHEPCRLAHLDYGD